MDVNHFKVAGELEENCFILINRFASWLLFVAGARPKIHFLQCGPEAHGPISDGQPAWGHSSIPRGLKFQQHLASALGGFPYPVLNGQKMFFTTLIHTNHHQRAQLRLLAPQATVDTLLARTYTQRPYPDDLRSSPSILVSRLVCPFDKAFGILSVTGLIPVGNSRSGK